MPDSTIQDRSAGVVPVHLADGERRFLLIQHKAGHWGFPKGHGEGDETTRETALRELAEETGLTDVELLEKEIVEQYRFVNKKKQPVNKRVSYFVGVVRGTDVTVQLEEVSDYQWADEAGTRERLSFDEGRSVLDAAIRRLDEAGL